MMETYTEHCGETINEPTPPEHEREDDCRNPEDIDGCTEYLGEVER